MKLNLILLLIPYDEHLLENLLQIFIHNLKSIFNNYNLNEYFNLYMHSSSQILKWKSLKGSCSSTITLDPPDTTLINKICTLFSLLKNLY